MEERELKEFPGYTITKDGTVKTYKTYKNGREGHKKGKEMTQKNKNCKNAKVSLVNKNNDRIVVSVPKLVAETFIPNPQKHMFLRWKKDGVNHYTNLEWYSGDDKYETLEWKEVNGFPNNLVSSYGHVLNQTGILPKILKTIRRKSDNIQTISLSNRDKSYCLIHFLVAKAFIPNPNNYQNVLRKDDDVNNNHYSNLYWSQSPVKGLENLEWKSIPGYSRYQISEFGHVMSNITNVPVIRTTTDRKSDYKNLEIYDDNLTKDYFSIHHLVALAFIPNPKNLKHVLHIDGDRSNNHYTNLKWSSEREMEKDDGIEWRDIPDFPGYKVSNTGFIKSFRKNVPSVLKVYLDLNRYPVVSLFNDKGTQSTCVHRIVASIFIPNLKNKPFVDHIDRNRSNNNVNNLRWATCKENSNNRDKTKNPVSKKVAQIDLKGNIINTFSSAAEAQRFLGLGAKDSVARCARGEVETWGGFKWKYLDPEEGKYIPKKGEIFKPVISKEFYYPNYQVSNFGTVINIQTGKKKKMINNVYGSHCLCHEGKSRHIRTHVLVASFFVEGKTKERKYVNHRDCNKLNPHYTNLEWVTQKENMQYDSNRKRYNKVLSDLQK